MKILRIKALRNKAFTRHLQHALNRADTILKCKKYTMLYINLSCQLNFSTQFVQILALLSKTWASLHTVVGVSCVLIFKLKAPGPQFQLGNFAVGQIEMIFPEESVTQSDDISKTQN